MTTRHCSRWTWWTSTTTGRRHHRAAKNGTPFCTSTTTSWAPSRPVRWAHQACRYTVSRPPRRTTRTPPARSLAGAPGWAAQNRVTGRPWAASPAATRSTKTSEPPPSGWVVSRQLRMSTPPRVRAVEGRGPVPRWVGGSGAGWAFIGRGRYPTSRAV